MSAEEKASAPASGGGKKRRKKGGRKGGGAGRPSAAGAEMAPPPPPSRVPWIVAAVIASLLGVVTWWAWPARPAPEPHVVRGNERYGQRRYGEALAEYESAPGGGVRNTGVHLDRGLARFRVAVPNDGGGLPMLPPDASAPEGLTRAQEELRTAARGGTSNETDEADPFMRARASYDLGNTYFTQHAWDSAIDAYKEALRIRPSWRDAAWNLELARRNREDERNPPDAGQDASPPDASQDSGNDSGNDSGQDSGSDSGNDAAGDSGGDSGSGDSGGADGGGGDAARDSGASPDSGAPDGGANPPQDGGVRDAQAPRSMAPLDDLDRSERSLQEEMLRRRGVSPVSPDDDR